MTASKSPSGAAQRVLVSDVSGQRAPFEPQPSTFWTVVTVLGAAVAVIGWTDLALLWYPLNFGSPEWEFGTISAHLDGMPLGTLGVVTLSLGVMGRGWRRTTRGLAVIFMAIAAALLGVFAVYWLDVPVALRGVAPQLLPTIKIAIVKATVFAVTYTALYSWLAVYLWQKTRIEALPAVVD